MKEFLANLFPRIHWSTYMYGRRKMVSVWRQWGLKKWNVLEVEVVNKRADQVR